MKRGNAIVGWLLAVMLAITFIPAAFAQITSDVPTDIANTPFKDWQLNLTTLMLVIKLLGEFFTGIRARGGIVGGVRGVLFGENVPKVISNDYSVELKNQPPTK